MHEVPLAYVEKETDAAFRVRSKLTTVPAHAPPSRVESLGGGFVLQHDRFVSYRAIGKHVMLWETPVHESSADKPASGKASLAIELPESVAPQGVRVFESLDKQFVSICVVTCAKTIHRYCYKIEPTLFSTEGRDEVAFAMSALPLQTSISAVCWLDECNVVVGGDDGAMIAINVGLSIFGHSHASVHEIALTDHHAADDDALAKDLVDLSQIDAFYMQRLGAPGRFNDECLRSTLSTLVTGPAPTLDGHRLRRALLDAVHRQWSLQDTKGSNPYALRSTVWRHVLAVATKHWAAENVPLGFVSCDLLGSPVLLRRNHMSVFFPATTSILGDRPATIADLYDSILLPTFAALPTASYYASLERQWQSDVLELDVVTSVTLLDVVHAGLLGDGRHVPSVLARTASVLSGDAATQMAIFDALVAHVALPSTSDDASMGAQDVAATDLALALYRMSAVVLHDMRAAAAASACFVTFLLDATPSFLAETTLRHLEATVRPALEQSLATWSNLYWLCSQVQSASGAPVLQLFASSILDEIVVDGDLGASTRSFIAAIADAAKLLPFLQSNGLHSVLRVVVVRAVARAWVAGSIPESVLATTLHHMHSASLSLAAIETALELRVAIPTWLRDSVVATDGPQLLSLLLKHGALDDALSTADALVPATEPLTIDSFGSSSTSVHTSWLPMALLDTLLASAMQVPALTAQAKALATKVEAHFRYVKALDAVVRV
ncbi:hypothetical protein SPRG_22297 [Saprolegnia parasitica CBS 223.65]|uniref:Uncharacterized protein n=1 Tax=Saprolegnia parasitica (strain CBS 223.65) TaxID=695850 RepID=A0A067BVU7_SAPPC|nr:hypothetical protein SPRG_22297 [Saprolegnia parasitica CBS 223.65]KDO22639.1 hypothetical protein SPRG_22297 [Saprolegnia parasitica CBS 223.65]|eukprot:XP_012206675.1 hypothetical protein SPRG_22297 [Saprolegnia parasitica CBS 223.65]